MEFYVTDFTELKYYIEFISDGYLGQTQNHTLWDYLGMTRADFLYAYHAWEKSTGAALAADADQ